MGWGSVGSSYKNLIRLTPPGWLVYLPNYFDIGRGTDLKSFNRNLTNYLNQNNLNQVYLAGHSMGGALALQYAHMNPERVEHLFLVDSAGVYSGTGLIQGLGNYLLAGGSNFKQELNLVLLAMASVIKHFVWHIKMGIFAHNANFEKEAAEINVLTTLMWGDLDRVMPLRYGQKLHHLIKNSQLKIAKGQGHNWIMLYPELFWANVVQ